MKGQAKKKGSIKEASQIQPAKKKKRKEKKRKEKKRKQRAKEIPVLAERQRKFLTSKPIYRIGL